MYKIAVMGDRDSIYGFAAVGLEPFPITETKAAAAKLKSLAEGGDVHQRLLPGGDDDFIDGVR